MTTFNKNSFILISEKNNSPKIVPINIVPNTNLLINKNNENAYARNNFVSWMKNKIIYGLIQIKIRPITG